jgi:hypothetical protein
LGDLDTVLLEDHVHVASLQRLVAGVVVGNRLEVDGAQVRQCAPV